MQTFTALVLPSELLASTSSLSGENLLVSRFFSPCSLRESAPASPSWVRLTATAPARGASEEEREDKGWFRPGGRGGSGQAGVSRGRDAPPREDTRLNSTQRVRHPRERRWPPPNPRRVYPSNLRFAPNPVYPKRNPFYPKPDVQILDQDDVPSNVRREDPSLSREPEDETYLRQLLKARSLNPKPSKSLILAPEEDEEATVSDVPYAKKRSPSAGVERSPTDMSADEKALREALKVRREQTREVLREHLKEVQLSKTFSQLVVEHMPAFVDHILIQAVALKSQERYVTSTFVARARACVAQTKLAEIVRWMKHNHVTYPRIGKLIDLKGKDLDTLRERIHFLKKNYVRGRDLGVVLTRHPIILERPLEELSNMIQLLEDAGVRRSWVGFVICRAPGVLALSIDELLDKISFFQALGVKPEYFGPMAFNFPASVGKFPLSEMQAKVEFLRRLGVADVSIGKAIGQRPQLLACDIENGWRRLVKYFKFLGIQDEGILRIFCVHPSVFCMNLEKNIAPKVRFFRAIGIREDAIGQVIVNFPALMSYSMDRKIRPVVRFILEEAGVKEDDIGKVIALRPQLIGTGLTLRLKPLVQYLRNQQLKREQIGRMVADFPMLLRYNLVVVESKFKFFKRHMKRPIEDLVSFPRFFSYSLEGRIKPRQQILKSNDIVLHLRTMLACNDETFDQRVKAALERRSRGLEVVELETGEGEEEEEEEELVQERTDWVPKDTNIWGAFRGEGDADTVDFDAADAWVDEEERLDSEQDDAANLDEEEDGNLDGEEETSGRHNHGRIASIFEDERLDSAEDDAADLGDAHDGVGNLVVEEEMSVVSRTHNDGRVLSKLDEGRLDSAEDAAANLDEEEEVSGDETESSWEEEKEEEDGSIVGEDIDFLMKYCV